jgi:hypothetical protein
MMMAAIPLAKETCQPDRRLMTQLLTWFAGQQIPIIERRRRVGGLDFHHFSISFLASDGRSCDVHGQSTDRMTAAAKCVGEYIERKVLIEFYQGKNDTNAPPAGLRTSNGWAVYFYAEQAVETAYREALERHLLLKSYLSGGWDGFNFIHQAKGDGRSLYFLTSRFSINGMVSLMVMTQSPTYPGISLGYGLAALSSIQEASVWQGAIFESIGKEAALEGGLIDTAIDPSSWILSEVKHYLECAFSVESLPTLGASHYEACQGGAIQTRTFNLSEKLGINFPFHAAFVDADWLIPLFHKASLSEEALTHLKDVLLLNGLSPALPERHPIL